METGDDCDDLDYYDVEEDHFYDDMEFNMNWLDEPRDPKVFEEL